MRAGEAAPVDDRKRTFALSRTNTCISTLTLAAGVVCACPADATPFVSAADSPDPPVVIQTTTDSLAAAAIARADDAEGLGVARTNNAAVAVVPIGSLAAAAFLARGGSGLFADAVSMLRAVYTDADLTRNLEADYIQPADTWKGAVMSTHMTASSSIVASDSSPSIGHTPSTRAESERLAVAGEPIDDRGDERTSAPLIMAIGSAFALLVLGLAGLKLHAHRRHRKKRKPHHIYRGNHPLVAYKTRTAAQR